MWKSEEIYRNRYEDAYWWTPYGDDMFLFEMTGDSLEYCRMGGYEGQEALDFSGLRMFDPRGGPYVSVGDTIDGKSITKLMSTEQGIFAEVDNGN